MTGRSREPGSTAAELTKLNKASHIHRSAGQVGIWGYVDLAK